MLKYLIPKVAWSDLPVMIGTAIVGGLLAGAYGIVHDQLTFAISNEYFTKLKFAQFAYADLGLGDRVFVSTIGFLATWWVGLICAWFLARRFIPRQPRRQAVRQICVGFACVLLFGFLFGVFGFGYGMWRGPDADYAWWMPTIQQLGVTDHWAFVRVAYIHNGGYLGGVVGLVIALTSIRPSRGSSNLGKTTSTHDKVNTAD